jgi:DNA-binding Lrp family transcriptional regulator
VLEARPWKGRGGGSDHDVYEALLEVAREHGWIAESGNVCVSVSVRELAERAGVSTKTCQTALKRLQKARLVYRIPLVTNGNAGVLSLRNVAKATQGVNSQSTKGASMLNVEVLSKTLRRFRHGAGRVTPVRVLHIRALLLAGGEDTVTTVAKRLERPPFNVRRTYRFLKERGLVEECGEDRYRVTLDLLAALLRVLREDGVHRTELAQRLQNERDRRLYDEWRNRKAQTSNRAGHSESSEVTTDAAGRPLLVVEDLPVETPEGWTYEGWGGYKRAAWEFEKRCERELERVSEQTAPASVAQVIELPLIDRRGERRVYAPTFSSAQPEGEMARNLPPLGENGIYHHGPECECWLCDEEAPEYVPAMAGVA